MAADWLDNCPLRFNPDQVDSDGDGLGDPCDPGQTATVILPASTTSLSTPDGAVSVVIPPMAVLAPHTLTLLPGADGFQVVGSMGSGATATMEVLLSYDVRVGGSDTFALQPGKTATLTLTIPATAPANQAFATRTLAIASKEDTDGVPGEDTFVLIPDCASGETTADGRCTVVEALDANGDLVTEAYRLSAPVTHFSTYGAVAIEVCTATAVFDPRTLNRNSAGNWVTVYLEFPGCRFGPDDVAVPTVRLRALTPARSAWIPVAAGAPFTAGDKDRDGAPDLMIKFDRPTVASWCAAPGEATFGLRGNFAGGTLVEATMAPVCSP